MVGRLPIRWRLAGICAGLTAAILIVFAIVLGNLVGDRIRSDFRGDLQGAATVLANEIKVDSVLGGRITDSPKLEDVSMANEAAVRILDARGAPLRDPLGLDLGPARPGQITDLGALDVATAPIESNGEVVAYVQFGRPDESVERTVDRVWLFLAAGVFGGVLLAAFAGLAVADRAMRPIAALTSLARDITRTRDPSQRMPVTGSDDEVGELAQTMDEMLEALDAARGERERAFERQREFVADASHELRTPLTSVLANLELLSDAGATADQREAIASALGSTKRMSRLVGDLSLLARADAGRPGARREFDLIEPINDAIAEARSLAEGDEITADLRGPLRIHGEPDGFHRLALNLLENAIRHTPADSKIVVSARAAGPEAVIEVSDDGPGIPEGMEDEVFGRFVRGPGPADVTHSAGSGLGLAIVRAVAESHGGSVTAGRSEAGGARFEIRVPRTAPEPPRPEPQPEPGEAAPAEVSGP